jgi:hypothetical protein
MTMSLRQAATVSLVCLATLGGAGCHSKPAATTVPGEEARRLLLDRNWLDRLPETARDRLQVFRFVPAMGGGVYQDRTLYAGQFELFNFEHDGETIRFYLRHTGEERSAPYAIERLPAGDENPYDLHLHIKDSPRGPQDYYSIRGMQSSAVEKDLEAGLRSLWKKPGTP